MTAYSGYLTRMAHYATAGDVAPGINPEHENPAPDVDPFNPQPDVPANQTGDIWNPTEVGFASTYQVDPVAHWFVGNPSVPTNVPYATAQQTMQDRMMEDHSVTHYVPDSVRLYQHQSEGVDIEWQVGREPQHAGESVGDNESYLMMGKNSYDATNQANEVYAGDPANVGRYRLGVKTTMFGLYDNPHGKFGQDAQLRGYTGLTPQFPADKTQLNQDAAPYTPNSSGTATWTMPQFQIPSMFGLPTETASTDYTVATEDVGMSDTGFIDDGRL